MGELSLDEAALSEVKLYRMPNRAEPRLRYIRHLEGRELIIGVRDGAHYGLQALRGSALDVQRSLHSSG